MFRADDIPDVGKDDINRNWAKFVFEVANIKDNKLIIDINVGLLREDAGEGTGSVFSETVGEFGTGAFHVSKSVVEVEDGRGSGLMGQWVRSDAGASVSVN